MLTNSNLAELLAREAEAESGILSRAYRRAARSAFLWPEEAATLISQNRPVSELRAIGPFISKRILRWIGKPSKEKMHCYPDRQDLNLRLLKLARIEGVRVSLGTDAHHP